MKILQKIKLLYGKKKPTVLGYPGPGLGADHKEAREKNVLCLDVGGDHGVLRLSKLIALYT